MNGSRKFIQRFQFLEQTQLKITRLENGYDGALPDFRLVTKRSASREASLGRFPVDDVPDGLEILGFPVLVLQTREVRINILGLDEWNCVKCGARTSTHAPRRRPPEAVRNFPRRGLDSDTTSRVSDRDRISIWTSALTA